MASFTKSVSDFDSLPDDSNPSSAQASPEDYPDFDSLPNEDVHASTSQHSDDNLDFDSLPDESPDQVQHTSTAKAFLEGVGQGVAGPLATLAETKSGLISPEEVKQLREEHPIAHGLGTATGFIGSLATGTGEAALLGKIGEAAVGAAKLGKIGSAAVRGLAETAAYQAGDEADKVILKDPKQSVESAIHSIGLAGALGGGLGAIGAGVVSPLWEATGAKPLEKFLSGIKQSIDKPGVLPEAVESSVANLGLELSPTQRAAISQNPLAQAATSGLEKTGHEGYAQEISNLKNTLSDKVLESTGIQPNELEHYSDADLGRELMDSMKSEIKSKYEPLREGFESIESKFKEAPSSSTVNSSFGDNLADLVNKERYNVPGAPQRKLVTTVLNRLPEIKTVQDWRNLEKDVNNMVKGNESLYDAGNKIKDLISGAQSSALDEAATMSGDKELYNNYLDTKSKYSDYANVNNRLAQEIPGIGGKFKGTSTLLDKIESRSPEQLLSALSPKNNAEIIPYLQQNFPETYKLVQKNELRNLIKPAIASAKDGESLNIQKLSDTLDKAFQGKESYIKAIIPEDMANKLQSAKTILDSMPKTNKTSPLNDVLLKIGSMGVGGMIGHMFGGELGGIGGAIIGPAMEHLAVRSPNAVRMGLLKFLGREGEVNAPAFKSMVDMAYRSAKGQSILNDAIKNVFVKGGPALAVSNMPNQDDRERLDKMLDKHTENESMLADNMSKSPLGYYMPDHQAATAETLSATTQYLKNLKPKPIQTSPYDAPLKPLPSQIARYNRALDIANQPAVVLQHVKDGTLQPTDVQDLKAMYPATFNTIASQINKYMSDQRSANVQLPYKTRMAASLLLGGAADSTMSPASIQAAQMSMQQKPGQPQGQNQQKPKGGPAKLGKTDSQYMTPNQAAETRRNRTE